MLRFMTCAVWLFLSISSTVAQQPDAHQLTSAQPDYVIEVHKADGCLFAPIKVDHEQYGNLVYAVPRPANFRPDSSGSPIISTIVFFARRVGELWNIEAGVGTGEFYDAGNKRLAAFTLSTNERAEVPQLDALGLGSFRVGVVRVITQSGAKPQFNNKTQSIALEKIEGTPLPGPYSVALKNNSEKEVLAIQYNLYRDQKFLFLKWQEKRMPAPLIKSNEVYRLEVQSEDTTCADPDGYRPAQSNRIDLVSVIFTDGTYEGEAGLPALVRGKALGNKVFLERTIAVMDNLNENGKPDASGIAFQLKYLYEGMNEQAEPYMVEALQNGLPRLRPDGAAALASFIRAGQHEVKTSLMNNVRQLERLSDLWSREPIIAKRQLNEGNGQQVKEDGQGQLKEPSQVPLKEPGQVPEKMNNAPHRITIEEWWRSTYTNYKRWAAQADAVTAQ